MNFRILVPALLCIQIIATLNALEAGAQVGLETPEESAAVAPQESQNEDADPAVESSLHAFVHLLDSNLSLSAKQHQTIVDRLRPDWHKKRFRRPVMVNLTGVEVIEEELVLFRKFSRDVLDKQQSKLLEQIEKFPIGAKGCLAVREAEKTDNEEVFKELGTQIMDQKISELAKLCKLSEEQIGKLKVASNGALKKLSAEQVEIMDSVEPDKIMFSGRVMETIAKPIVLRCTNAPIWKAAFKETLTQEQAAKFKQREAERTAILKRYACNQGIDLFLVRRLKTDLSNKQLSQVEAVFMKHVKAPHLCDFWNNNGLDDVPKASLVKVLGQELGEKLHQAIAKEAERFTEKDKSTSQL